MGVGIAFLVTNLSCTNVFSNIFISLISKFTQCIHANTSLFSRRKVYVPRIEPTYFFHLNPTKNKNSYIAELVSILENRNYECGNEKICKTVFLFIFYVLIYCFRKVDFKTKLIKNVCSEWIICRGLPDLSVGILFYLKIYQKL